MFILQFAPAPRSFADPQALPGSNFQSATDWIDKCRVLWGNSEE